MPALYDYSLCNELYLYSTEWSFSSLFSRPLASSCPLASHSRVVLEAGTVDGQPDVVTTPPPSSTVEGVGSAGTHIWMVYDVENITSMCE